MKRPFLLCLLGAAFGGLFPGAVLAFFITVAIGGSEVFCCSVNLGLAVGSAFIGVLVAKKMRGQNGFRVADAILPIVLGLACGLAGYEWLYWVISTADPPL